MSTTSKIRQTKIAPSSLGFVQIDVFEAADSASSVTASLHKWNKFLFGKMAIVSDRIDWARAQQLLSIII